jgi:hypothetical protein
MKKFGLLIPKYIFVQYKYVLMRKFGFLLPKYIFVLCVYLLLIAVLIFLKIYLLLQSEEAPLFLPLSTTCGLLESQQLWPIEVRELAGLVNL